MDSRGLRENWRDTTPREYLHADTLLKDTANPWFDSITPVTEFITTCRPNARIESEYEV